MPIAPRNLSCAPSPPSKTTPCRQIKPAPEFNGSIDSSYISGLGTVSTGDDERMLILMDIEQMMSSNEMGLMDGALH